MIRKLFSMVAIIAILFLSVTAFAQKRSISGTVTDATNGEQLLGVTVMVKGSASGTVTDFDGKFNLEVSGTNAVLVFSFVGYKTQEIQVGSQTSIDVKLAENVEALGEVVVTALGIKRDKKALGYAITDVRTDELTKAREVNVINSLAGKVAGLQISQTAGGVGGSSRIVIRGNSSIGGNNSPLIVVDGIPIDNSNHGTPSWMGGIDYGSGISDVNPDDIESLSVLKGPNAAALYGSRAANGVILIITKKGKAKKGIGVTINSSTSMDKAYILLDLQNEYGMGFGGAMSRYALSEEQKLRFGVDTLAGYSGYGSWGPKMSEFDEPILTWYGEMSEMKPQPNNVKDYFETGYTYTNSISIDGGSDITTYRLSFTNLHNEGIKPNSRYDRNTFNFRGTHKLSDKLSTDVKFNYIRQDAYNREGVGDARTGMRNFVWMPRNIETSSMKEHMTNEYGSEISWYGEDYWHPNPYWASYNNPNSDTKDRIIAGTSINYDVTDWLSVSGRLGTDFYNGRRYLRIASFSLAAPEGRYTEQSIDYRSVDADFLLIFKKNIGTDFEISANVGGAQSYKYVSFLSNTINGFAVPNFFSLNNYKDPLERSMGQSKKEWQINSFYGSGQLGFRGWLFVDFTARNDWSSTLPDANNSYFYPSVSGSWVITEAFGIKSDILPFAKVTMSWSRVGNDAEPYMLQASYYTGSYGQYLTNYMGGSLPLTDLKPENTESVETGTDLRLLNNRVGIDVSLYKANTYNQILRAEISKASGFNNAVINAGEIENKGIEVQLNLTPFKNKNLTWDVSLNFAKNKSAVVSLADDISTYTITEESQVLIEARPGYAYGNIVGSTIERYYKKDDLGNVVSDPNNGRPIINAEGLYNYGQREIIGNINPDFTGGLFTNLTYKSFNLSMTFSFQKGGDIFSKTNKYGNDVGNFAVTTEGRDSWYAATMDEKLLGHKEDGTPVGYLADGVMVDTEGNAVENNKGIDPQVYWHQYKWGGIAELSVYDCTNVKLRELVLGYNIPKTALEKTPFTSGSVSLVGRNLWLIYSALPNVDPESSFSSQNNGLGQEYAPLPQTRSFGVNIKFSF